MKQLIILGSSSPGDDENNIQDNIEDVSEGFISPSSFPQDSSNKRPNKFDLYEEDELLSLLNIHEEFIAPEQALPTIESEDPTNLATEDFFVEEVFGLHESILEFLGDETVNQTAPPQTKPSTEWLDDETKQRIKKIRAIASDIDGTLLTSRQTIHPRTKMAVEQAVSMAFSPLESIQWFFPATGKSRAGTLNSIGPDLAQLLSQTPGVFLQGLYCVDGQGKVLYERRLNTLAVEAAEELGKESGVSIIAYDGDNLLTTDTTEIVMELATKYGEPTPQKLEKPISEYGPSVHKILFLDHDTNRLDSVVRPKLEALAKENGASVTQAMPTMLELLPEDCSKAVGVKKLCENLGIDMSSELLALGDAENDAGMLEQSSIGVAMNNASPIAREAADFVMDETNDEGGAGAAIEVFGFGQY